MRAIPCSAAAREPARAAKATRSEAGWATATSTGSSSTWSSRRNTPPSNRATPSGPPNGGSRNTHRGRTSRRTRTPKPSGAATAAAGAVNPAG